MSSTEDFVAACQKAASESQPLLAVKEIVELTTATGGLDGLSDQPGIRVLCCNERLCVLHVVIPPAMPQSLPHDHRMWAVIGMCAGREHNEFFRRSGETLTASGGRVVEAGETLALGSDVIHSVGNSLAREASSALHVYGGDLLNRERTMWTRPDWREEPYDARKFGLPEPGHRRSRGPT